LDALPKEGCKRRTNIYTITRPQERINLGRKTNKWEKRINIFHEIKNF
jgi:hypothetical protein